MNKTALMCKIFTINEKKQQVSKTPGIKELQKLYLAFGYLLYEMSAQISLRENGSCEVFKAN